MQIVQSLSEKAQPLRSPAGRFAVVWTCILAVFVWSVAWYPSTAREIFSIWWRSETYAHGLVVLPVFVWLVWRLRERVAAIQPRPVAWIALPVAGFGMLWLLGELASVAAASHSGLVLLLISGLVGVLGWQLSRALLFPIAFLLFAIPIGDFMLPTLMKLTAEFTVGALRLSGVPVYQDGLHFVIPNGRWSVVEACSGIRYLIASVLVGALYAYLTYTRLRKRALFMLVAILVPVVANWARAYMIVMLGYLSNNEIATGVDHLVYGWVFFGVIILLMFMIGQRWADEVVAPSHEAPPVREGSPSERIRWAAVIPLAITIAAFPLIRDTLDAGGPVIAIELALPSAAPGWTLQPDTPPDYAPHYSGYRASASAVYRSDRAGRVSLYSAAFAQQTPGNEMITWGNGLVAAGDESSNVVDAGLVMTALGPARHAFVVRDGLRHATLSWYVHGGQVQASEARMKLRLAADRLLGRSDASVVYVVSAQDDGEGDALRRLLDFVTDHASAITAAAVSGDPGAAR